MSNIHMYRLIVDSRRTGILRRESVMRRQLESWRARQLNQAFKEIGMTDRYVKERAV
jgi:hypothetical protein